MSETKQVVQAFPKTYDYSKVKDVLDVPETYIPLLTLDVPYREVGVYEFKMATTFKLNLANKSVFLRWRINGADWNEFISEPKDRTDDIPRVYFYPFEHSGGKFKAEFEIRKEDVNGTLDIHFFDAVLERKG